MLTENFYIAAYSVIVVTSLISLAFSLLVIFVVVVNRQCHSVSNLLICHTSAIISLYAFFWFWTSALGLREGWTLQQTPCIFQGYVFAALSSLTCYSYVVQALSRLFFVLFSTHRVLLTYRVHFGLIASTWLLSAVISIEPFFYNGFQYEKESRACVVTAQQFNTSFYIVMMVFLVPLNLVIVIYGIIFKHIQNSTNRVMPVPHQNANLHGRRELKVFLNIIIPLCILAFCGIPAFILVIWHTQQAPPDWFYLIRNVCISLGLSVMSVACFSMNKPIQEALSARLRGRQATVHTLHR